MYKRERPGHTLQPMLLVNEAYMNLVDQDHIDWKGRSHFFTVGAQAIRGVLVHRVRSRNAITSIYDIKDLQDDREEEFILNIESVFDIMRDKF